MTAHAVGANALAPVVLPIALAFAALMLRVCRAVARRVAQRVQRFLAPSGKQFKPVLEVELSLIVHALSSLCAVIAILGAVGHASQGQWLGLVAAPVALTALFPWALVRWVLAPLGRVKGAYWAAWLCEGKLRDDAAGPAMAAAWAAARTDRADDEAIAWVEAQLSGAPSLTGAGLVGAALICAARGERQAARDLLESCDEIASTPAPARCVAASYLAALAAEEGRWAALAERPLDPASTLASSSPLDACFLIAAARRLVGHPAAPRDLALWLWWAAAPRRRATLPLLRRALAAPATGDAAAPDRRRDEASRDEAESPPVEPSSDALARALARHARWLDTDRHAQGASDDARNLVDLGAAWDAALADPEVIRRALARSVDLGVTDGASVLRQIGEQASLGLARAASERGLSLAAIEPRGPILERAARISRDETLAPFEAASEAVRRRVVEQRALPAIDEWRAFLSLRDRYRRCADVGGTEGRRLAWPRMRADACKLAVWLWNERRERIIAHAIFRWLLAEATALGDETTIELQKKNVACGE